MAYELKNGQGSLFCNDNKSKETQPDYKGKIKTPDGKEYSISMWIKGSERGDFYSISIQEPYKKQ